MSSETKQALEEVKAHISDLSPRSDTSNSWEVVDHKKDSTDVKGDTKEPETVHYDITEGGKYKEENITEDGLLRKALLKHGDGEMPPPMNRVYATLKGYLTDGTVFIDTGDEETDFVLGKGETATGLQMAVCTLHCGDVARVYCGKSYGYSDFRRPKNVPKDAPLIFEVGVLRHEKDPNLVDMSVEQKIEYLKTRREIGKQLFTQNKFESASKQYQKALDVIGKGLEDPASAQQEKDVKELWTLVLNNSAACKLKLKKYQEAIQFATKALELESRNVKALYRRAQAYRKNEDFDEAVADYRKLLTLDAVMEDQELKPKIEAELKTSEQLQAQQFKKEAKKFGNMFRQELYADKPLPPPPPTVIQQAGWVCKQMTSLVTLPFASMFSFMRSLCKRSSGTSAEQLSVKEEEQELPSSSSQKPKTE